MKKTLAIALTTLTLAACSQNADYEYDYPRGPQYNMRERSHNYWTHGDQNAKCDCHKPAAVKKAKKK